MSREVPILLHKARVELMVRRAMLNRRRLPPPCLGVHALARAPHIRAAVLPDHALGVKGHGPVLLLVVVATVAVVVAGCVRLSGYRQSASKSDFA